MSLGRIVERIIGFLLVALLVFVFFFSYLLSDLIISPNNWNGVLLPESNYTLSSTSVPTAPVHNRSWFKYENPLRDFGLDYSKIEVTLESDIEDESYYISGWYLQPPESAAEKHMRIQKYKEDEEIKLKKDLLSTDPAVKAAAESKAAVNKMLSDIPTCSSCDNPPRIFAIGVVLIAQTDIREMEPILSGLIMAGYPLFIFTAKSDTQGFSLADEISKVVSYCKQNYHWRRGFVLGSGSAASGAIIAASTDGSIDGVIADSPITHLQLNFSHQLRITLTNVDTFLLEANTENNVVKTFSRYVFHSIPNFVKYISISIAIFRQCNWPMCDLQPLDVVHRLQPRPFLIFHGNENSYVPISLSQKLYKRSYGCSPRSFYAQQGGGDDLISQYHKFYAKSVVKFLESCYISTADVSNTKAVEDNNKDDVSNNEKFFGKFTDDRDL